MDKIRTIKSISKKTRKEVERLKKEWLQDPCYPLANSEGFEAHKEELEKFEREHFENILKSESSVLGLVGLYEKILIFEELLRIHKLAMHALCEGNAVKAYEILQSYRVVEEED